MPYKKKLSHLHMRSGGDDGDSDGDDDISFDVLEIVCCCLSMLCKTKKSHNHNPFSQEKFDEIGEMAGVTAHKNFGITVGKTKKKYLENKKNSNSQRWANLKYKIAFGEAVECP